MEPSSKIFINIGFDTQRRKKIVVKYTLLLALKFNIIYCMMENIQLLVMVSNVKFFRHVIGHRMYKIVLAQHK